MIICRSDCIYICSSKWEVRSRIPIWLKKCCVVSSAVKQERKEDFCEFLSHQYHQETWVSRIKQCLNAWKQSTPGTWSKIWHLKKKEEGKRWRLLELRKGTSLSLSLSLFSSPHQPTAAQVCSTLSLSLSRGATNKQAVQNQRKSDQNLVQECIQHVELPSAFPTKKGQIASRKWEKIWKGDLSW